MGSLRRRMALVCLSLLAGLALAACPAPAEAASIGFKNNTKKLTLYIEAVGVVRGRLVRAAPLLIKPDKTGWHMNIPIGPRVIYIYDANKPGRILFQGRLNVPNTDLYFHVEKTANAQGATRVKLIAKPVPQPDK